jgi:hypothetical protein
VSGLETLAARFLNSKMLRPTPFPVTSDSEWRSDGAIAEGSSSGGIIHFAKSFTKMRFPYGIFSDVTFDN